MIGIDNSCLDRVSIHVVWGIHSGFVVECFLYTQLIVCERDTTDQARGSEGMPALVIRREPVSNEEEPNQRLGNIADVCMFGNDDVIMYSKYNVFCTVQQTNIYSSKTFLKFELINMYKILYYAPVVATEVEVRSISLIISKTHFFHCFLFLPGILYFFHSFSKTFLQKLSLPFFNNLENQTTFLFFILKF